MGLGVLVVAVAFAATIAILSLKAPGPTIRGAILIAAAVVLLVGAILSSTAYVGSGESGIVNKTVFGPSLKGGRIIAIDGQLGVQANVLSPGWHFGYWPVVYTVRTVPLIEINADELGIIEARDGLPLPEGQLFAPEWDQDSFQKMLDAEHFLTVGKGYKGKQASVLTPGKYRINSELFRVTNIKQTEVVAGEVAVLKANFGAPASVLVEGPMGDTANPALDPSVPAPTTPRPGTGAPTASTPTASGATPAAGSAEAAPATGITPLRAREDNRLHLADANEMGVRHTALGPGKYPINTDAYTVVEIWTTQMIAHYTAEYSANATSTGAAESEERAITVRTSDGFTFPVDVRIEYHVRPENAPIVVAKLGDDEGDRFRNMLNSVVRAVFRNNAENVRALDYVQQRSTQERQSLEQLVNAMAPYGVTVTAVRIGNVGDEKSLGALLKTQTDREIAKQEQITFQEQQRAAEQKKELTRATQEAEEEKRLATASYEVKIAEESQRKKVIEANAEAQSIQIKADAQAKAYELIASQIGKSNAAMLEMLKLIGERNIQITPRVMMVNGNGGGSNGNSAGNSDAATTALIGTMLDHMVSKDEGELATPASTPAKSN